MQQFYNSKIMGTVFAKILHNKKVVCAGFTTIIHDCAPKLRTPGTCLL